MASQHASYPPLALRRSPDVYSDPEPILWDSSANPSETREWAWVYCRPTKRDINDVTLGKWLVFRPFPQIDETWHMIRREIELEDGLLNKSTRGAKCSALYYNPSCGGPGPKTSGVICVYTTTENVDKAGLILINMVKHDIKYKTDKATLNGAYAWKGKGVSVCLKTLYWNDGRPSFVLEGETCYGPKCGGIKDEWHLNLVTAPEKVLSSEAVYGRWVIVTEEAWELTGLWHLLRKMIQSGELGPVEMECPSKRNYNDPHEDIVFLLYTDYSNKELVGRTLASHVKKDILYELRDRAHSRSYLEPTYNHCIVWDKDQPFYMMTLIPKP